MFFRRSLPLFVCFVFGVAMIVQAYVPTKMSQDLLEGLSNWVIIISSFAVGLGVVSLCRLHWGKMRRLQPGWGFSVVTYVGLIGTLVIGVLDGGDLSKARFGWIYWHLLFPLQATMFSILAFYVASAAFRAFRARSFEATLLLLAASVVILGRLPVMEKLWDGAGLTTKWIPLKDFVGWIMKQPNLAAQRAITFGLTLGVIATSLKIIFGIERAYLGSKE